MLLRASRVRARLASKQQQAAIFQFETSVTLTANEARQLQAVWTSRFPDYVAYETSITRYLDVIPQAKRSFDGAERWLREDVEAFDVRAAFVRPVSVDPLAEAHPQQDIGLTPAQLERAIAAGDIHDFRDPLLPADQHAAQCPRCQMAIHAREVLDARAQRLGKRPFPSLGDTLLQRFQDTVQRCDDCGLLEDVLAPDTCGKSFWHLPDIYLALHPDCSLEDMGQLGPFMRGFLRRQRVTL